MRILPALVVVAACVTPPPAAEPATAVIAASPFSPDRPDDRVVLGWLDGADRGIDCPMSLTEARRFRTSRGGGSQDYLVKRIACLCDVVFQGPSVRWDDACARPYPIATRRHDGDEPAALDVQRLVGWEARLVDRIRSGVAPDGLTRLEPLDDQIARIADEVAVTGDLESEHWRRLVAAVEQVRRDARGEYGCLLIEQDVKTVEVELANHERLDLRGAHSVAGRALLAEARGLIKPLRGRIRACKRLEHDPEYQRLQVRLDAARERLASLRLAHGSTRDQAECNSDTDDSSVCRAAKAVWRLEKRMEQKERGD
jgi:hypothetical protein